MVMTRNQQKAMFAKLNVQRNKFGFITEVKNPKGGKGSVSIAETGKPGLTVFKSEKPFTDIKSGFKTDTSAINFAVKKGYRVIKVR